MPPTTPARAAKAATPRFMRARQQDLEAFVADWNDERLSILQIADKRGVCAKTIRRRAAALDLPARGAGRPSAGARGLSHVGKPCPGLAACPERPALVARLWAQTEAEIRAIEASPADGKGVATLGALAGTLTKLVALDRATRPPSPGDADAAFADPYAPDRLDARRSELLRGLGLAPGPAGDDARAARPT